MVWPNSPAPPTPSGRVASTYCPAPDQGSGVNWLTLCSAVDWAPFAGFALYLWYRLARDAWEKEVEDLEDEQSEALAAGSAESRD